MYVRLVDRYYDCLFCGGRHSILNDPLFDAHKDYMNAYGVFHYEELSMLETKHKTVVLLSGGLDSAVLLYHLLNQGHEVLPLAFNYGQAHYIELEHGYVLTQELGLELVIKDLGGFRSFFGKSALTNGGYVPMGKAFDDPAQVATVVPMRNLIFLSIASAYALTEGADLIAFGAHRGDAAIYPDCRPKFIDMMSQVINLSALDTQSVGLIAPFRSMTKIEIVKMGGALSVPFEFTYSCYVGASSHCGKCGACMERQEAFRVAQFIDPANYDNPLP